jgi:hypothetical protein
LLSIRLGYPLAPAPPAPWQGAQLSAKARLPNARAKSSNCGVVSISFSDAAASLAIIGPRSCCNSATWAATELRVFQFQTPRL